MAVPQVRHVLGDERTIRGAEATEGSNSDGFVGFLQNCVSCKTLSLNCRISRGTLLLDKHCRKYFKYFSVACPTKIFSWITTICQPCRCAWLIWPLSLPGAVCFVFFTVGKFVQSSCFFFSVCDLMKTKR